MVINTSELWHIRYSNCREIYEEMIVHRSYTASLTCQWNEKGLYHPEWTEQEHPTLRIDWPSNFFERFCTLKKNCVFLFGISCPKKEIAILYFLSSYEKREFFSGFNFTTAYAPSTRVQIFFNPQIFLSGYGFRPPSSHLVNSTANPDILKSALWSVTKINAQQIQ